MKVEVIISNGTALNVNCSKVEQQDLGGRRGCLVCQNKTGDTYKNIAIFNEWLCYRILSNSSKK